MSSWSMLTYRRRDGSLPGRLGLGTCPSGTANSDEGARAPYLHAAGRMSTAALLNTSSRASVWSVAPKRLARSPPLSAWQQRPIGLSGTRTRSARRVLSRALDRTGKQKPEKKKTEKKRTKNYIDETSGGKLSGGMAIARVEDLRVPAELVKLSPIARDRRRRRRRWRSIFSRQIVSGPRRAR